MKALTILIALLPFSLLNAAPVVSNLSAAQRADASKLVDIYYDVANPYTMNVTLQVSNDNGATWAFSCALVSGDVGANISPGTGKHIVWDVLTEHPDISGSTYKFKVTADDGMPPENFAYVPPGTFLMGDTRGGGQTNELPVHSVTISALYVCKYEVTQGDWFTTMGSYPASGAGVGASYPVYNVSWFDALDYCNARSVAEGLTPVYTTIGTIACNWNANGYRLLTEAEWEYAARGATNDPDYLYSGSDDVNAVAWYSGNNTPNGTKPVGTKLPNGLGIYDMSGNVFEWTWDWYLSTYYSVSPSVNPTGPDTGTVRTWRGGHYSAGSIFSRISRRGGANPGFYAINIGFRVCRKVP